MADQQDSPLEARLEKARNDELSLEALSELSDALADAGRFREAYEVLQKELAALEQERAALEQRAAAAKQERATLDQRAAAAKQERAALEQERATLEQERAALKAWRHERRFGFQKAIQHVYFRNHDAALPELALNSSVEPSMERFNGRNMNPQKASYLAHTFSVSNLWNDDDMVVPTYFIPAPGEDRALIFSGFNPQHFPLKYHNELEILVHVRLLVEDAIVCIGCRTLLDLYMESSFYGMSPDMIFLRHERTRQIVFVIQVKSPNRPGTDDNVLEDLVVGGQLWLYLMSMKQSGIQKPMGAICTFNALRLVSLDSFETHMFDDAKQKFNTTTVDIWPEEQPDRKKQASSPDSKKQSASEKSKKLIVNDPPDSFDTQVCDGVEVNVYRPLLYGSETVQDGNVFRMLLLALTTAMLENDQEGASCEMMTEVQKGNDIGSRLFAFAKPDMLGFARAPPKLVVQAEHPHTAENFFILDIFGPETQGEVRLIVSTAGMPAAVKFYRFKPSRLATPDDRKQDNESRFEEVEKAREKEWDLWQILYHDRGARKITLGGFPCLLMPYGTPIPIKDRSASLSYIESELIRFRQKGFAYPETDLDWHHVFKDMHGTLFLSNLGSLEPVPDGEDCSDTVQQHLQRLKVDATPADAVASSIGTVAGSSPTKRSASGGESTPTQRLKSNETTQM